MTETFYEVLGVSPDASTEEIESAYRDRLKETHPDLSDSEDASELTQRVIRARDVLTDEDERRRYDRIGHDAYVGSEAAADGSDDVSSAAAAARRAGYGDGADGSSGRDGTDRSSGGTGGSRNRRRDRRARERTARERVDGRRSAGGRRGPADGGGRDAESGTTTDGGTANSGPSQQARAAAAARRRSRRQRQSSDESPGWIGGGGYSVRRNVDHGIGGPSLFRASESLPVLGMSVVLYPVMLFSAVFPAFPLIFRAMVAICLVCFVLYLQSMPEVGVIVFGVWSLIVPLALAALGVNLAAVPALLAITGTLVPFCLSTSAFFVLYG